MQIIKDLISVVPHYAVSDLLIGKHTIMVTSNKSGIASNLQYDKDLAKFFLSANYTTKQLAEYSLSKNLFEASVGFSAINSSLSNEVKKYHNINAKNIILEKGAGKTVGIIGHFPFVESINHFFKKLMVFEKDPKGDDFAESEIKTLLPEADVVAITGTTLSNHSFSEIMKYVSPKSYRLLLGPTTPLTNILFDYGIDAACGILVKDSKMAANDIRLNFPFRKIRGLEYVCILKDEK